MRWISIAVLTLLLAVLLAACGPIHIRRTAAAVNLAKMEQTEQRPERGHWWKNCYQVRRDCFSRFGPRGHRYERCVAYHGC